ncbi:VOC family protein [Natronomonas sp. EA1]|uniref:VOC family protein n=1 Tax=Natronomonas sp. EA1 TaxID=3421655 RepID=UPI003EBEE65C
MHAPLDHVMMRVEDLDASLDWYQTHLDYEEKGRWEADTFTNVYLGPAEMGEDAAYLELTYNHGEHTYDMGDKWGHIAVRVPEGELEATYDQLMDEGVEDYRDPESCGGRYAFVKDPDGHEIEIVQRDEGTRFSIDHTMIRIEDPDSVIGWWARKLEYELFRRYEGDSFALYFLGPVDAGPDAMSVELTYNYDGRSYTDGDAWGHLAARVEDLDAAWETLQTRGADDYRSPADCDDLYAFTRAAEGFDLELLEEHVTN